MNNTNHLTKYKSFYQITTSHQRNLVEYWTTSKDTNSTSPYFHHSVDLNYLQWVRSFSFPGSTPVCGGFFFQDERG